MLQYLRKPSRIQAVMALFLLALTALLCLMPWTVTAQNAVASDGVRVAQQWEDVLLLEATDYLQATPRQYKELQSMAEYARGRMGELDRQRVRLKEMVQEQHESVLHGKRPTASEQSEALASERKIRQMVVLIY